MNINTFFNKKYTVFILPKHSVEVLSTSKKVFWVSHFTTDCGANETVSLPLTKCLYNIN